ncbi:hypothetical protein [Jatrophihabitans sp.]|uniref:hypothetical protein n=1 Tax=Jatrophihabitans sp. TaxID=1932789 RepID=UPI0030C767FC|nr:hypothetical protein [Jatrophihabitans sp.]
MGSASQQPGASDVATMHVAVALLEMVSTHPEVTAAHLADVIRKWRREKAYEGSRIPGFDVLEQVFAELGTSARQGTRVQHGAVLAGSGEVVDGEPMTDLLDRKQTSRRMRCSVDTVKRREIDGSLTPIRNGRLVFHRVTDIDAYLNRSAS